MRKLLIGILAPASLAVAGCGGPSSDASTLRRACRVPPPGSAYDWSYATVDGQGAITGVAACGTDGTVQNWIIMPHGNGDKVRVYSPGQSGA